MDDKVRDLVDRAVKAGVPAEQMVTRKSRPESEYGWQEPAPLAGLQAALQVAKLAQQQAYKFVLGLRGEGTSWREVADLLEVPWSDEYARPERAYELVLGPAPDGSGWRERCLYWRCAGVDGCGKYITDRGPYNGHPADNEDGHAEDCRRAARERATYLREQDEREARDLVADEALKGLEGDRFAVETVQRARYVQSHGGRYRGWSTSEVLAVALVLRDDEMLEQVGHSRDSAVARVFDGMAERVQGRAGWVAAVRAAATGMTD